MALDLLSLFGLLAGFMIFFLIVGLALYIYSAIALMALAKRTHTNHGWMAWIPYLQFYLVAKIAKKSGWPVLILIVPIVLSFFSQGTVISVISSIFLFVFMIFIYIWWWKILKIRGKPGWWILLTLIPIAGGIWALVMVGILAWGKDSANEMMQPTQTMQNSQVPKQ